MDLQNRIKQLCELNNISVKELARRIEMSEQNIYACFKRNSMEVKYIQKIADVFNISLSDFFMAGKNPIRAGVEQVAEPLDDYREGFRSKYVEALEEIRDLNKRYQDKCKAYETMCAKYKELCDHLKNMGVDPEKIKQTTG